MQILCPRNDLTQLIEGVPMPMKPFVPYTLKDNWLDIDRFETIEEMVGFKTKMIWSFHAFCCPLTSTIQFSDKYFSHVYYPSVFYM